MEGQGIDRSRGQRVVVVDGNATHRAQVAAAVKSFYTFSDFADAKAALDALRTDPPAFLLVGETLPPADGYDFVRRMRQDHLLAKVPVYMVVSHGDKVTQAAVHQCGANGCLVKPYRRSVLIRTVSGLLNWEVEQRWDKLPSPQREALKNTVEVFNNISDVIDRGEPIGYEVVREACEPLVEAVNKNAFKEILHGVRDHDNYSYAHSMRVATLLSLFGFTIRLSSDEQSQLASGGLLHDVGKMSIPHEVLNKPGRLTAAEFEVMKSHVSSSVRYLHGCTDIPRGILIIAGQHHEKLDGSGYPRGLAGNQLSHLARMASIVDVFSALTDRRIYKPPMDAETALKLMADEMGHHLDMALLMLFREMLLDATTEGSA